MSSSTSTPVTTAAVSTSSHKHVGAIVGGVIGGVAFVLLVALGILLYVRVSRQTPSRSRRRSMIEGDARGSRPLGKWDGLSSHDSTAENVLASASFKPKRLSSSASRMQAITHKHAGLSPDAFSMPSSAGHDTILGASASDEGGFSMSEETKVDHYPRSTEDIPVPYTSSDSFRRGRMPSTGQDSRAIALEKLSTGGHSGLPSPPGAHYDSGFGSSPTDTPYTPNMSPISPTTSPATGRAVRRQTTRKPVPSYSPSLIINQAEPNLSPQASVIATDDESSGSGASTPRGASHSREDLRRSFGHLPQLSHKASFGMGDSRPVHYLVPDPPPAAHPRR